MLGLKKKSGVLLPPPSPPLPKIKYIPFEQVELQHLGYSEKIPSEKIEEFKDILKDYIKLDSNEVTTNCEFKVVDELIQTSTNSACLDPTHKFNIFINTYNKTLIDIISKHTSPHTCINPKIQHRIYYDPNFNPIIGKGWHREYVHETHQQLERTYIAFYNLNITNCAYNCATKIIGKDSNGELFTTNLPDNDDTVYIFQDSKILHSAPDIPIKKNVDNNITRLFIASEISCDDKPWEEHNIPINDIVTGKYNLGSQPKPTYPPLESISGLGSNVLESENEFGGKHRKGKRGRKSRKSRKSRKNN